MANHGPNPRQYSVEKCKECKKGDEIRRNIGHQCNCCGCTFGGSFNNVSFGSRENGKKRREWLSQTLLGNSSFPLISFYVQLNDLLVIGVVYISELAPTVEAPEGCPQAPNLHIATHLLTVGKAPQLTPLEFQCLIRSKILEFLSLDTLVWILLRQPERTSQKHSISEMPRHQFQRMLQEHLLRLLQTRLS